MLCTNELCMLNSDTEPINIIKIEEITWTWSVSELGLRSLNVSVIMLWWYCSTFPCMGLGTQAASATVRTLGPALLYLWRLAHNTFTCHLSSRLCSQLPFKSHCVLLMIHSHLSKSWSALSRTQQMSCQFCALLSHFLTAYYFVYTVVDICFITRFHLISSIWIMHARSLESFRPSFILCKFGPNWPKDCTLAVAVKQMYSWTSIIRPPLGRQLWGGVQIRQMFRIRKHTVNTCTCTL